MNSGDMDTPVLPLFSNPDQNHNLDMNDLAKNEDLNNQQSDMYEHEPMDTKENETIKVEHKIEKTTAENTKMNEEVCNGHLQNLIKENNLMDVQSAESMILNKVETLNSNDNVSQWPEKITEECHLDVKIIDEYTDQDQNVDESYDGKGMMHTTSDVDVEIIDYINESYNGVKLNGTNSEVEILDESMVINEDKSDADVEIIEHVDESYDGRGMMHTSSDLGLGTNTEVESMVINEDKNDVDVEIIDHVVNESYDVNINGTNSEVEILDESMVVNEDKNDVDVEIIDHVKLNDTSSEVEILDESEVINEDDCIPFTDLKYYIDKLTPYEKPTECSRDSKVWFLENATDLLSCMICNNFTTNDEIQFQSHMQTNHRGKRQYSCIFCCSILKLSEISKHLSMHREKSMESFSPCKLCGDKIDCTDVETIITHMKLDHDTDTICPFCQISFNDPDDLEFHLGLSMNTLFICSDENCKVMSHDEATMMIHKDMKCHEFQTVNYVRCIIHNKNYDDCCSLRYSRDHNDNLDDFGGDAHVQKIFYESPYCQKSFNKIFSHLNTTSLIELQNKMDQFAGLGFAVSYKENKKVFHCCHCVYRSEYSVSDIKKHLIGLHCSVPSALAKDCLKVAKYDENYQLCSYKNIIKNINASRKMSNTTLIVLTDEEDDEESKPDTTQKRRSSNLNRSKTIKLDSLTEIQPSFSSVALGHFCSGRYFSYYELLNAKITMLCKLKGIYVHDEEKGRMLQCSQCSSVRQKKYSDLFKHFMIIHAQIPKNLRAIVKACCRTDRHYNLLPDNELIKTVIL